jgi:hypothetical protein
MKASPQISPLTIKAYEVNHRTLAAIRSSRNFCRIAGTRKGDDRFLIQEKGDRLPDEGSGVDGVVDDEWRSQLLQTQCSLRPL